DYYCLIWHSNVWVF
nr:immunoglobulin light chain junction region [Macaca mulatta]MOX12150.1 immunoglobulin light chain junction region [Macaca mulatta]MOX12613.1 immunoglobulin light chain junction region [Macaca mulatta]MOX13538.1 immunoglobulin light chain junction region [Macaca mulatta]